MRKVRKFMCLELHKGEEHWTVCDWREVGVSSTLKVRPTSFLYSIPCLGYLP
jgi:hypothetical protein